MPSFATKGWKVVQIVISVVDSCRGTKGTKGWKKPFKKLKLSKIRAEQEWAILLDVDDKEYEKIHALLDGRFRTETVLEPVEEQKAGNKPTVLGRNVDLKV